MGAPTRARWQRRRDLPGFIAVAVLAGILLSAVLGLSLGAFWTTGRSMTPVEVAQGLLNHELEFTGSYFAAIGGLLGALVLAFVLVRLWWTKSMPKPSWVDVAAQHMASPKEVQSLSRKATAAKAKDLGVNLEVNQW